jgi:glutamine amidotransferase
MNIIILDYGIGNVQSIKNALKIFGIKGILSSDRDDILKADGVIFPGVGAFKKAMMELRSRGLDETIKQYIKTKKPLLGICLGMQLLFDSGEEFGKSKGLGILQGNVWKLPILDDEKLPNIGWNPLIKSDISWSNTVLDNVTINENMYFIHSYVCNPLDKSIVLANAKYGNISFCASLKYNNIYGCQFHPEKSSTAGLKVIENFINIINQEQI